MYKKSHRALAATLVPLLFIPIEKIEIPELSVLDQVIGVHNLTFNYLITNLNANSIIMTILFLVSYYIGSTFPDQDMKLKHLYSKENQSKRYLYHRQISHSVLLSIGMLFYSYFYLPADIGIYYIILTGFAFGIIAHQIGDMLTGSIPWLLYAPYYIRFARIGITVFLPKAMHEIFTRTFPKFLNENLKKIFIPLMLINILVMLYFRGTISF